MTWLEALEIVVARTGHERFRELCSILNTDDEQREAYRALVTRLATGEAPTPQHTTAAVVVTGRCCGQ